MLNKKAVVLLSGGLDSSTLLYWTISKGYKPHAIIFNYGQRHKKEITSAVKIAKSKNIPYSIVKLNFPWKGSALLDRKIKIPKNRKIDNQIPITYVPARNTVFLALAGSYAETVNAKYIFIGANIVDYSGYPDCRPEFLKLIENSINKGTKRGFKKPYFKILAPFVKLSKLEIVKLARELKVPINITWSCYSGGNKPCGVCDSCRIREKAMVRIINNY